MLSRAKFYLKPSAHLTRVGVLVWGLVSACAYSIAGGSWLSLSYALLAAFVVGLWLRRYAWLKDPTSVVAVSWTPEELCCYLANGEQVSGTILPKSAFNPQFITLHLSTIEGGKFWWPLMADSGPADGLRKLRVFGRWHQQEPPSSSRS